MARLTLVAGKVAGETLVALCQGVFITLAAVAFTFSVDWRRFQGLAVGALFALIVVGLISAFVHFLQPGVYAWATLGIFTLLTLVDFSRIRAGGVIDRGYRAVARPGLTKPPLQPKNNRLAWGSARGNFRPMAQTARKERPAEWHL